MAKFKFTIEELERLFKPENVRQELWQDRGIRGPSAYQLQERHLQGLQGPRIRPTAIAKPFSTPPRPSEDSSSKASIERSPESSAHPEPYRSCWAFRLRVWPRMVGGCLHPHSSYHHRDGTLGKQKMVKNIQFRLRLIDNGRGRRLAM